MNSHPTPLSRTHHLCWAKNVRKNLRSKTTGTNLPTKKKVPHHDATGKSHPSTPGGPGNPTKTLRLKVRRHRHQRAQIRYLGTHHFRRTIHMAEKILVPVLSLDPGMQPRIASHLGRNLIRTRLVAVVLASTRNRFPRMKFETLDSAEEPPTESGFPSNMDELCPTWGCQ